MSKLFKAIAVVLIVWVVLFLAGNGIGNWLPSMFHLNNLLVGSSKDEILSHGATDLTSVIVESHNGSVILHGVEREDIEVRVHYTARSNSSGKAADLVQAFTTDFSETDGQLLIKANFGQGGHNNQGANYEIFLPKDLTVQVQTSNGTVEVLDMTKAASIDTSNAAVTITSSQAMDTISVDTSNGMVKVAVSEGMEQLTINTSNSQIDVNGSPQGGNWHLQTSNSSIRVALPASLGVTLDAQTSNSSIDVGGGSWSVKGGIISNKQVNATRGDGALELYAHTSNSGISISDR